VAYTADINIVVRGQAAVNKLQQDLDALAKKLDDITKRRIGPSTALETFNAQLAEAKRRLNEVAAGTSAETEAIKNYVTALGNANAASDRQNKLIQEEINLRQAATGQVQKLADRQAEFTARTNEAAQAAHRQTAEFLRQQRVAKQVAAINATAPAAQLLLPAAAPGAPAMSGGARRRITGPVERLGGARTEDQAAMALRFAQALQEQVRPLSQIDALYAGIANQAAQLQRIKALPDSAMLNASARGIKQLETGQDKYNRELQEGVERLQQVDRLEESRARRARKLQQRQEYFAEPPAAAPTAPGFGAASRGRLGGALSSGIIGGGFPLLFGQGPAAAIGGGLGGLAGGLVGGGFGFALSILGTAIGDSIKQSEDFNKALAALNTGLSTTGTTAITTGNDIKQLASDLNVAKEDAIKLVDAFSAFENAQMRESLARLFGPVGGAETFEAIAKAGVDEQNALNAISTLRKQIGNTAAEQLMLQLQTNGAAATQAALLDLVIRKSLGITGAQEKQVEFADLLLSTWEGIVAALAGAVSLAVQFLQKMQETSLIKIPFLSEIQQYLTGVKARTPEQIAGDRQMSVLFRLNRDTKAAMQAIQQQTSVFKAEQAAGAALKPDKGADRAAREAERTAQRIRDIQLETQAIKQLSYIQGKIVQAEIARDDQLVIRLQGVQREQEVLHSLQKSLEGVGSEKEKQALLTRAQAQLEQVQLDTAAKLELLEAKRVQNYNDMLYDLQSQIPIEEALTEKARRRAEIEQQIQKLVRDKKLIGDAEIDNYRRALLALDQVREKTAQVKRDQAELQSLYQGIAGQITGGIGTAIDLVVRSTDNLGESLQRLAQDILTAVGKMLIFYGLAKAFGALGGSDGQGIFSYLALGFGGDTKSLGFAEGGFVTAPTRAMVGEGGESEYVIPASKMRGAMNRYAAGARGSAVIPAGSEGGDGMTATMAAPGAIDVRYTVERINSVDYVTADQFQRGMQQAAAQGAAQGEQRTLRRLQSSNSTRKRLGI
jgi:hypothetical protein